MTTRSWRILLLAVCLCCIAINAISLFTDAVESSSALGFQVSRTADSGVVRVDAVDSGGAAERSGLRVGDLLQLRELSSDDRYRILTGIHPHERIALVVSRDGRAIPIAYVGGGPPVWRWDVLSWAVASFWLLGFATLIGWRRADLPEARVLCLALALTPAGAGLMAGAWLTPSPFADMIVACIGYGLTWLSVALFAAYPSLFGRPLSPLRKSLTWLAYASAGGVAIYEAARLWMTWTGALPWVAQSVAPDWNFIYGAVPYLLALATAWAALASVRGAERSRMAWTVAPLSVFLLTSAGMFVVPLLFPASQHGGALTTAYAFVNVGALLAPLGMTYALLNRRVLDIGFALNRVAIFSGVSLVIVGTFVLIEWALGTWLQEASHTASLVVGAAVALLLGFSIRFVHARVEQVLDRVFFQKRHQDEEAIRRFAREAPYVTDVGTLLERTTTVLEDHADSSFVSIALHDGNGCYGSVSENDPAILSLRTWHSVLDLHDVASELRGEYAYPMTARGRLVGALVLGPKRSREAYAPDESQAIEELARGLGSAIDLLQQANADVDGAVIAELRAMRAAILDGFAALRLGTGG